ncbi:MAG TPA: hypothetical protein VFK62_03235 [Gaiellaceae bacterium]|nr:hypothetical protein [Gaiellaceae bacterium]
MFVAADGEQVGRNDVVFRAANEAIAEAGSQLQASEPLPFICECADTDCRELILPTRPEYEAIRRDPTWFAVAHGHEGSSDRASRVVERRDAYDVVQKTGEAAAAAEALDPRGS